MRKNNDLKVQSYEGPKLNQSKVNSIRLANDSLELTPISTPNHNATMTVYNTKNESISPKPADRKRVYKIKLNTHLMTRKASRR